MLTEDQFERVRRLASRLAGIELAERHRELLHRRTRRSGILDEAGLNSLLRAAEAGESAASARLVSLLTTKFTTFFRHPRHFELAMQRARQGVDRTGSASVWSAGTATGEEAWSLAMAIRDAFPEDPSAVQLLATDIDREALAVAQAAEYGETALATLPAERRERHFQAAVGNGRWTVRPELRSLARFEARNLIDTHWPGEAAFDVIFCRNVLMYLAGDHRQAVLRRLAARLHPEGLLMLDPAEHLGPAEAWFARVDDGVYRLHSSPKGPSARSFPPPDLP